MKIVPGIALLLVLVLGACKKDKELAGVGKWNVKTTTLKDATGRCLPENLADGRAGSYCFAQPQISINGMTAEVDLFFAGVEPESPLVRIQLKVKACNEEMLFSWMQTNFGDPYEKPRPYFHRWKNSMLYIAGRMPVEPGLCLVDFYPAGEKPLFEMIVE